ALAYAREQLGEPYRYGASGPSSWDCSGLTMRSWAAGGKTLPHYSVAQYQQSTPITLSQLQPGDLLFWSDSGPSGIYHVAIYTGNGMMIHAPRPGRSVEEVSMYYWVTPNLFARP
ncbi:MAG TPA: NlpC/P60 family protein, partial [Nocardioides sp.]|nr:NlpC/P60 family protein [Nocardioides sp.]